MAEAPQEPPLKESPPETVAPAKSQDASRLPAPIQQAIEKLPPQEAKTLLSVFMARTTTMFGPDPETAKIIADSEMHGEDCRLKAYQSSLQNKETQNARDHDFRKKKLNHQTAMSVIVLVAATGLIGLGIYIQVSQTGNALGGYLILGGGALLFHALGIRPPAQKE